jgi:very-short-patch-repair endonuclease
VVSVGQTLISLADAGTHQLVRRALSVLDYRDELDFAALLQECGRGRRGAVALRKALAAHDPMLARANEGIEQRFLDLCRKWRLPAPEMNVWVHEVLVDAFWAEAGLVVEFDGLQNHSSAAQLRRDHMNDLLLRSHGLQVRRYDTVLLSTRAALVRRELEDVIVGRKRDSGLIR